MPLRPFLEEAALSFYRPPSMDKLIVTGGHELEGDIYASGSKNSALPILAATLLTKEQCVIHHVPDLSDIHYMLQILSHLGAQVERASGVVRVEATQLKTAAPYDIVRKMRASGLSDRARATGD